MTLSDLLGSLIDRIRGITPEAIALPEAGAAGSPLKDRSAQIIARQIAECFEESQTPAGEKWPPAKDPNRPWPHKLEILTGAMQAAALSAAHNLQITPDGFVASMDEPYYAQYQQFGTNHIPAREFFGVGQAAATELAETVGESVFGYLVGGLFAGETIILSDLGTQVDS